MLTGGGGSRRRPAGDDTRTVAGAGRPGVNGAGRVKTDGPDRTADRQRPRQTDQPHVPGQTASGRRRQQQPVDAGHLTTTVVRRESGFYEF